jgi:hypothetical protein
MYADEADQDAPEKRYLIYGAIYVPSDAAHELTKTIIAKRVEYGFPPEALLKFSTGTIPTGVTREAHAALKSDLLAAAAEANVRAVCYVVQHDLARTTSKEVKLKWAMNTLVYNFQKFLRNHVNDCGLVFFDRTTDFKQEEYLKELMQHGLPKRDGKRIPIDRIIAANSTQVGLSQLNSLCDVVVGSFRFVFNEPDKDIVGKKLFKQLAKFIWGDISADGKKWYVLDKGLIFRPKEFTVIDYEADKEATVRQLVYYMNKKS